MKRPVFAFIVLACCSRLSVAESLPAQLDACGDGAEWPPFTFFERLNGQATANVQGYDVSLLAAIFEPLSIRVDTHLPPWSRCLYDAARGERYQLVVSASLNAQRKIDFLSSEYPYYVTTPFYFYSRKHLQQAPQIQAPADLLSYHLCGLAGYNYQAYGIDNQQVDMASNSYGAVIQRLDRGTCDLMLAEPEILAGFTWLGALSGKPAAHHTPLEKLGRGRVPGASTVDFYLLISKKLPYATELKTQIDLALQRLRAKDALKQVYDLWQAPLAVRKNSPDAPADLD